MTQPTHVAIIMDGNGRWAKQRHLPRAAGHKAGVQALRDVVRAVGQLGISYLTVFAFSSENWSRPANEITYLLGLFRTFVSRDLAELHKNNVRVRWIGNRNGVAEDILALIEEAEALTVNNTGLTLVIAFNYGSRDELARAARQVAIKVKNGEMDPKEINEDLISRHLDTHGIPDPELLIRTSGELRLSNFMLWQAAYTEFYFSDVFWPDFGKEDLLAALSAYEVRDRRFGGIDQKDVAL